MIKDTKYPGARPPAKIMEFSNSLNDNSFLVTPFNLSDNIENIRNGINTPILPPDDPDDTEINVPPPDTEAPNSTVEVLPNSVPASFTVTWYGFDLGGSGVASYDIFVSTDGGEFVLWQNDTSALSATFNGQSDRTYEFYSVATDNVGNVESNSQVQASTTTNGTSQQPAIYRLFNTSTGVHLYTSSVIERNSVIANLSNYQYEGVSYFSADANQGVPVYRLYSPVVDGHFYTVSPTERDQILANFPEYVSEGEAFTAFADEASAPAGTVPVYRFFVPDSGAYFYTVSDVERDSIIANLPNYTYQGIAYYSYPLDADFTQITPPPDEADGSNFLGSNIFLQIYAPDGDTAVTEGLFAIVGDGIEFSDIPANDIEGGLTPIDVNIDIAANNVFFEVEQAGSGTFASGDLNGYVFVDADDSLPPIQSVTVDEGASLLGVDDADIFFTEDGFVLDVAGVSYSQGDTVKLDVAFGEAGSTPDDTTPPGTSENNFLGAQLDYQTYLPNFDSPVGSTLTSTVGEGIEFDLGVGSDGTTGGYVDIDANSITYEVDFPGDSFYTEAEFNGFIIVDSTDSLPAIQNITINQAGTDIAIDEFDIVFTENGLAVNLQGLAFSDSDQIKLDVDFV
ncbi:MAG: hypothetical protein AAGE96_21685 [Cyanobacteria bacterium P01_G01_bin.19]